MFRRAGWELGLIHQVEAGRWLGGTLAPEQPRVSLIHFFLVTFRYFVSEMVLTYAVSIYVICKYGNGVEIVFGVERSFSSSPFGKFFYRRKRGLMNVDKQHVLQQLCSVSVDFQQFQGSISLLKKT